ncbi:hypothetical protein AVEN_13238-1 [Araneus ventricosus]|uniref:Uncharacterized protein n=1 Tax=Araneus ventricosus TaxID=182803 RepID=A0A4Y2DNF5_ARAVE|nr:hypothetical protein AVEN_13238-1 [Araneus ventricosus]
MYFWSVCGDSREWWQKAQFRLKLLALSGLVRSRLQGWKVPVSKPDLDSRAGGCQFRNQISTPGLEGASFETHSTKDTLCIWICAC